MYRSMYRMRLGDLLMTETKKFERRQISRDEWLAEGKRRFGDTPVDWPFQCVRCGHVQTGRRLMDRYALTASVAMSRVYFSCEGRLNGGDPGCDWSLGGLLQLHTLEVLDQDGEPVPVFEFAEGRNHESAEN